MRDQDYLKLQGALNIYFFMFRVFFEDLETIFSWSDKSPPFFFAKLLYKNNTLSPQLSEKYHTVHSTFSSTGIKIIIFIYNLTNLLHYN